MDAFIAEFAEAYSAKDRTAIADLLKPIASPHQPQRLHNFIRSSNVLAVQHDLRTTLMYNNDIHLAKDESSAWIDVFTAYWQAISDLLQAEEMPQGGQPRAGTGDWVKVYQSWRNLAQRLTAGYRSTKLPNWSASTLESTGKYLRAFAVKADETVEAMGDAGLSNVITDDTSVVPSKHQNLEDAARTLNGMFSICAGDKEVMSTHALRSLTIRRSPLAESRKWEIYSIANIMFRIYFQVDRVPLCRNTIRTINTVELPPFEQFPKSHQVTYSYYCGVMSFLTEDYEGAENFLSAAWKNCHPQATKNKELIMTYLVPCHMVTSGQVPSAKLLNPFPKLSKFYLPFASAIKSASLADHEAALVSGEEFFAKRRVYLALERTRAIVLRNLFRKVFVVGGFDELKEGETAPTRRTRIPIAEFTAALQLSSRSTERIHRDETECLLANMIYKGHMKGYIHRDRAMVVLAKSGNPFPGSGA